MRRMWRLSLLSPLLATGAMPAMSGGCSPDISVGSGDGFSEGHACSTSRQCCGFLACDSTAHCRQPAPPAERSRAA